ncbi:50S ribosomal protein L18 [Buchnera aphidicola (Eriosoma grossulariae)]|uniref:50S ribosomal protein L18 n=1 Tax=Buchnera aphidicola TaxID=9 RepID=UPI003463EFA7
MKSDTAISKKVSRMRRARRLRCQFKNLHTIRLVVHRTSRHMYVQIISADNSNVLVSASTLEKSLFSSLKYTGNKESAALLGQIIAERALDKKITVVSFDRSGFQYHGRIQVLAESARKFGLRF